MKHAVFAVEAVEEEARAVPVARARIEGAKRAFATRRIDLDLAAGLICGPAQPRAGDLVLARIETLGQHRRLEAPCGRRVTLYAGDEILVVYGDRYAPDQFEAEVPGDLGPCALVAGGGIAAAVLRRSGRVRGATRIAPVGLVTDALGRRLNTRDFAIATPDDTASRPAVIAVVGSSMNAGKTTALSAMVRGEALAGRRVGALKATGTGSGGDLWSYRDAGAEAALDFTDAGWATTHRIGDAAREAVLSDLVRRMAADGMETVLVEIADGLLLDETARLIDSPTFRGLVDGVVFAAADAMGALGGIAWLEARGLGPIAVSGAVTASPIALREVQAGTAVPVLTCEALAAGGLALPARRWAA